MTIEAQFEAQAETLARDVLRVFPGALLVAVRSNAPRDATPGGPITFQEMRNLAEGERDRCDSAATNAAGRANESDQRPESDRTRLRQIAADQRRRAATFDALVRMVDRIRDNPVILAELRALAQRVVADKDGAGDD